MMGMLRSPMPIREWFAGDDFNAMTDMLGQAVWWVPARPCSCYAHYADQPIRAATLDPNCRRHDEAGYQYLPAQWITGSIMQNMQQNLKWDQTGMEVEGIATWLVFPRQADGSPNPAYSAVSDHDLIIAIEALATITDPVPVGQTRLSRPIIDVLSMALEGEEVDPGLYTVANGELQWSPALLGYQGRVVSLTWRYAPVYTLLTSLPEMRVFADREWPRQIHLQERTLMGSDLWQALSGKVPGWNWE